MAAPVSPLIQVQCTLQRRDRRLVELPHVVELISACLDASLHLTPTQAAARRFPGLFDRTLARALSDPAVDPAFRTHWLARAIGVAIQKNDVALVQHIHHLHPAPLHVRSLALALEFGSLELVQWIIEHRADRRCRESGLDHLCPACFRDAFFRVGNHDLDRVVEWLSRVGPPVVDLSRWLPSFASRTSSPKILKWLNARGELGPFSDVFLFMSAMTRGEVEVIQLLLDRGFTPQHTHLVDRLVFASCQRQCEAAMDLVVASRLCDGIRDQFVWAPTRPGGAKVLQWDVVSAEGTMVYDKRLYDHLGESAHSACSVDTLEWLRRERGILYPPGPPRQPHCEADLLAMLEWMVSNGFDEWTEGDARWASSRGYIAAIQWLHAHKPEVITPDATDVATQCGHFPIIQWLYTHSSSRGTADALMLAAQNDHLDVVQYLIAYDNVGDTNSAMAAAAVQGHLEILKWMCVNCVDACPACVLHAVLHGPADFTKDFKSMASPLDALRWLSRHNVRAPLCQGRCVELSERAKSWSLALSAMACGDLDLAEYVLEHHGDSFWANDKEVDVGTAIATNGHLCAAQWVETKYPGRVRWEAAIRTLTARREHGHILAWLVKHGHAQTK